jgi:hypothetical protein
MNGDLVRRSQCEEEPMSHARERDELENLDLHASCETVHTLAGSIFNALAMQS